MKGANRQMKIMLIIFSQNFFGGQMDHFGPKNSASLQLWIWSDLHNEKGQLVNERNINGFYQKKFVQDKWAILGPKMAHPPNSGLALRIFFKFCTMGDCYVHENFLSCFLRKNFIWANLIFLIWSFLLFDWAWVELSQANVTIRSLNSQDMVSFMITTGSLNSQDMIRILKKSGHDFTGKHLCDGYCMDIMWSLCVQVKVKQRVIWCCKASLRNCYVILFECKGT